MPIRAAVTAAFLAAMGVVLAACDRGPRLGEPLTIEGPLPSLPPVPYEVRFPADLPPDLARLLPEASAARREARRPPTSILAVRQRARGDVERLQQALRSEGYYDATVGFQLLEPEAVAPSGVVEGVERAVERPQAVILFEIDPGPRYLLGELQLGLADNPDDFTPPSWSELGLEPGQPARAQAVLDAEQRLLARTRAAGHALARLGERDAIVDHETERMDVTLRLAPGARARFGEVTFTGDEGIDAKFLRERVPINANNVFRPELVQEGQRNLFETNLFSTVIIQEADRLDAEDRLDIRYDLRQRPHRSLGANVGYRTDEGVGIGVFWEHRNILGAGERLRAEISAQEIRQQARLTFNKPDFLSRKQSLLGEATYRRERSDAFDSTSIGGAVGIERRLTEQLRASLGTALRYARIEESDVPEERYLLASLPARLEWNTTNDPLDPIRGGILTATATPMTDLYEPVRTFLRTQLTQTRYLELMTAPQLVLALRGSAGWIFGVDRDRVPADERFYSGGGGSIRGIGYQLAGPLDEDDKPLGGRALLEGSVELRTRFANNLGGVLFVDVGTVDDEPLSEFDEQLLIGVGPGLRYFTPIGPVRVDVGFPVNPRQGVDDSFQLYISIGQAF